MGTLWQPHPTQDQPAPPGGFGIDSRIGAAAPRAPAASRENCHPQNSSLVITLIIGSATSPSYAHYVLCICQTIENVLTLCHRKKACKTEIRDVVAVWVGWVFAHPLFDRALWKKDTSSANFCYWSDGISILPTYFEAASYDPGNKKCVLRF